MVAIISYHLPMQNEIPYGKWPSPMGEEVIALQKKSYQYLQTAGEKIFWVENRPEEKGRCVLLCFDGKSVKEALPKHCNVRSRVNEYGGGAFLAVEEAIFFTDQSDQKVYVYTKGELNSLPIEKDCRYADFAFDETRNLLYAVCEDLSYEEPVHSIVKIDVSGRQGPQVVASGHDFYGSIVLSEDRKEIAFISWDHPNMPWDGNQLWLHPILRDGDLSNGIIVEEGASSFQPRFDANNHLFYASDKTGYWNLIRFNGTKRLELHPKNAEFGLPQWVFGQSVYDFVQFGDKKQLITTFIEQGEEKLGLLSLDDFSFHIYNLPFRSFHFVATSGRNCFFIGATDYEPASIIALDSQTGKWEKIASSWKNPFDPSVISVGQKITFSTEDGDTAHAIFYPPCHPKYIGPDSERPPLIVKSHGGPTAMSGKGLNLEIQYWTSRGFAFADVNYRGSTGYGKAYRDKLKGQWGIVDVNDVCSCARYLAKEGLVDKDRCVIRGSSAGGYTVLAALCFRDVFAGGSSYYGVSDLNDLVKETHKFEAHYLDQLIGPYESSKDLYNERSPIHHLQHFKSPILLLQGGKDKVVPPGQAEKIYHALKEKGLAHLILYKEESHGFRIKENLMDALHCEHLFYLQLFQLDQKATIPSYTEK
jgi:dipeptidyl aminopeptidase/acylaminoacyl peptidase